MTRSDRIAKLKAEIEAELINALDREFGNEFLWPSSKVFMELTCREVLKNRGIKELPMFDIHIEDDILVVRCHHWPSSTVWQ